MTRTELKSIYPTLPNVVKVSASKISRNIGKMSPRIHGEYKKLKYTPIYGYESLADPYQLIYVNPDDITEYWGKIYYFNLEMAGEIYRGDWDQVNNNITNSRKFRSVRDHFEDGIPWEETKVYLELKESVVGQGSLDGISSINELDDRYEKIDEIYERIKHDGYKTQTELNRINSWHDEICVSIGRDGNFIFNCSGWHRLSIAKILNLNEIPVRVIFRHKLWQDKREKITQRIGVNDLDSDKGHVHPDIQDLL